MDLRVGKDLLGMSARKPCTPDVLDNEWALVAASLTLLL